MSRNVKRKFRPAPPKASKRRDSDTSSSSFDLSDEGGYSAVEDISDSEDDDEEDVNAAEEENILTQVIPSPSPASTPRPTTENTNEYDSSDDNPIEGIDESSSIILNEDGDDNVSWHGIVSEKDSDLGQDTDIGSVSKIDRHVRFALPSDSDSDSTDTEDDYGGMYSDIFVAQTQLDPNFRREVELDPDDSSGSEGFWDYGQYFGDQRESEAEEIIRQLSDDEDEDATPLATPNVLPPVVGVQIDDFPFAETPTPFQDPSELDGYETDGDTTEEDIPEPPVRRRSRRPSLPASDVSDSEYDSPAKTERGQPRVGRFSLDKSDKKPIAVLNPLTRKMMIFTPHQRRQLDLSPEQFHGVPAFPIDASSPMLSNSANMMFSAMFSSNTFADFVNGQAVGPTEAFFPDITGADESEFSVDSQALNWEEEEDEAERGLNLNDFISFEESDSSDDEDKAKGNWDPSSTPARPTTASSEADVLSHLNSDIVGAFRRNQVNQQLILSNQATQDSLAFSGPYNHTAIRGLRSDRFDTAGVPLTPVRRHKSKISDLTRSPLESFSAKRKASAEVPNAGHKKQRSISDVNNLHL
ncbi:unnamed protein product [Clonostachys rosea f. rosea IK726]|uniref:Uncharacterized protein n=3 Tax=Bionectria ochroleuca TaxID=29856 RepID=A0A0B7KNX2_BIOOC|nr:unnamed protein product [Clonostachys rosea f. rosea IK726]